MTTTERRSAVALAALLVATFANSARAQDAGDPTAIALFTEGKRLMREGKPELACPKFAASAQIARKAVTILNLADCYEKAHRLASAWAEYVSAAGLAAHEGRAERRSYAEGRAAALEQRVARIRVVLTDPAPGVEVRQNGVAIPSAGLGSPIPTDAGKCTIVATAPGRAAFTREVAVEDGAQIEVRIPLLEPSPPAPEATATTSPSPVAPAPAPHAPPPHRDTKSTARPWWPLAVGGAGVVSVAIGSVLALGAKSQWSNAIADHCGNTTKCDAEGGRLVEAARTQARWATVPIVAGGLLAAGGVAWYLWSSPATSADVAPELESTAAGIRVRGSF
jgi:hypothetical protein